MLTMLSTVAFLQNTTIIIVKESVELYVLILTDSYVHSRSYHRKVRTVQYVEQSRIRQH